MIFRFKQFAVCHGNSSMKVGTDAVLLGAWAEIKNSKIILDIGTGSGIIALMMAQKNKKTIIKGIDIDEKSIVEAKHNFEQSPWKQRLEAKFISLQDYSDSTEIRF
ncbi:MAG: 50S ribosomal protein L11 methyltransferase, partial [Bacteroidia bacterium]